MSFYTLENDFGGAALPLPNNNINNAIGRTTTATAVNTTANTNSQPSTLESLFSGLIKPAKDIGNSLIDLFGSGHYSIKDLITLAKTGEIGHESEDFLKRRYNTDSAKEAHLKSAGTALNGAVDLAAIALPAVAGLGGAGAAATGAATNAATTGAAAKIGGAATKLATTAAGNALTGAVGGVADEFQSNGENATLEGALKRAAVGGTSGAIVGGMNKGLNNAVANGSTNKLLNNGLTRSAVGRGALSGAVGGAIGGGGMTALNGGDAGDIANAALSGAGTGAISGAATTVARNQLSKIGGKINTAIQNNWERQQDSNFIRAVNDPTSVKKPIYLGEVSTKNFNDIKNVYSQLGLSADDLSQISVVDNKMYLTQDGAAHLNKSRLSESGQSAAYVKNVMRNATKNGTVVPGVSSNNATMGARRTDSDTIDVAHIGVEDGHLKLETTYPSHGGKTYNKISSTLDGAGASSTADSDGLPERQNSALQSEADDIISQNHSKSNSRHGDYGMDVKFKDSRGNTLTWAEMEQALNTDNTTVPIDQRAVGKRSDQYIANMSDEDIIAAAKTLGWEVDSNSYRRAQAAAKTDLSLGKDENSVREITVDSPTKSIEKKNVFQKIGSELQRDSQETRYQGLLDSLDKKTAERAVRTGAMQKLADLDVNPQDYESYAETSSYVNKAISDLAKDSKLMVEAPDLVTQLSYDNSDVVMSDTAQKKYNSIVKQIVADGDSPTQYSASYLLEKSRELGSKAANLRGNTDDVKSLRAALTDAKYVLRDTATTALENASITGENTTDYIANGLKQMGANQKVIDYYSAPSAEPGEPKAPTAKDYISRSALFEQARDMGAEATAEKYVRSASKLPQNVTSAVIRSTGVDRPVKTILSNTVAPVAASVTNGIGKGISGLGNLVANNTSSNASNTSNIPSLLLLNTIGRESEQHEANANANRTNTGVNTNLNGTYAEPNSASLEALFNVQNGSYDTLPAAQNTGAGYYTMVADLANGGSLNSATPVNVNLVQNTNTLGVSAPQNQIAQWEEGLDQLDTLRSAMQLALDAGDYNAYQQIAKIYDTAYDMYDIDGYKDAIEKANSQSTTKLSQTQQRANAAAISLNQLANMTPDAGYNLSGIPIIGNVATFGGNQYEATAKSLATQIGYMLSGANISEREAENIGKAYVPQPFDSEEIRQYKLNLAAQVIQQYQNVYAE